MTSIFDTLGALATPTAATTSTSGKGERPITGVDDSAGATFRELVAQSLRRTTVNGLRTDAHHMPLPDPGTVDEAFDLRSANILAERQQLIAANIANADTPNYKARDFDLRAAMRDANLYRPPTLALAATSPAHQAAAAQRTTEVLALKYQLPRQGAVDANTVDMDVERGKFAENNVRLQFALNQLRDDGTEMARLLASMKE